MRRSFATRLAVAFGVVGFAGAAITAVLVNVVFGGLLTGYLDQQQQAREDRVVALLAGAYAQRESWDTTQLDELAPSLAMESVDVRVEDASGRIVWDLANARRGPGMMSGTSMQQMMGGASGPERRVPITVGGQTVGAALIRQPSTGSLPADEAFRSSVTWTLLIGGLVAAVVAMVAGIFLARRATVPVRELTRAAQELASGMRNGRVSHSSEDEFGAMATAFNEMADSIAQSESLRRTFASDVAHELRTPLMILMSHLEAMEDGVVEVDSVAIRSLHEETQRLSKLVADLEVLASADAARFSLSTNPLDLRTAAAAAAEEFRGLYEKKSVTLEAQLQPAQIVGDPARLNQVVRNLLSNALKFTPPGGLVRLTLEQHNGQAVLEVADSGPGIASEDLPRVFERFFRGHGARSGGSGIGLTVVHDLVAAQGGEVEASNRHEGGALFTVRFPVADEGLALRSQNA